MFLFCYGMAISTGCYPFSVYSFVIFKRAPIGDRITLLRNTSPFVSSHGISHNTTIQTHITSSTSSLCLNSFDRFSELEKASHSQYFSFRVTHPPSTTEPPTKNIKYIIENAKDASYAIAWPGTTVCTSTDLKTWRRVLSTEYDADKGHLTWVDDNVNASGGSTYYAYFPPFSYQDHLDLIARCSAADGSRVRSLGQSLDGREIECVTVGSGERVAWVIHRQHPGESMAEFFAEGLLTRLLGLNDGAIIDSVTRKALEMYTFHIVPNMCPDGGFRGHLRTNACGSNLNREWAPSENYMAPTLERSPEVYHVLHEMDNTGVDIFCDIHGDEELPVNFIAGAEGCPNWGPRLQALQGAFTASYSRANDDMQQHISYEPEPPNEGRLNTGSNQIAYRFDCLAVTLEMPFKDCITNPDPEYGWSPDRSRKLGASLVDPLVYVHPNLRTDGNFWDLMPKEDDYIRPTAKY